MNEIIKDCYMVLIGISIIPLIFLSASCVIDMLIIYSELINGGNVEYQRFILDILGCIFIIWQAYVAGNDTE